MSKTSSTSSGETKQDDTQLHYLGTKLIYPATTKEELTSTDLGRWTAIFSYLHFNEYERLSVRTLCRLFHTVLPGPTCAGVYTMYPHPNHASLNSLMNRLNYMAHVEGIHVEHLFLANNGLCKDSFKDITGHGICQKSLLKYHCVSTYYYCSACKLIGIYDVLWHNKLELWIGRRDIYFDIYDDIHNSLDDNLQITTQIP